ncbi:GNAT family N-acetyltransferase [Serratia proteamaculans]|uniref:GNAT family N-acetyltransferase n=1 Tax=Serratia proteamaculans TaxID=28151 RepID=UPI00101FC957|nr:GNAT family N-acetyltransferase [Serratia proteamaculans]RYM56450.1 N-acetyltransferase [Serratia proteamaculans]
MIIRQARPEDYPAILQLQTQNTPANLSDSQKRQGFIVSSMNEAQLTRINQGLGILVAVEDQALAGFVCLMTTDAQPRPPVVDTMLEKLAGESFNGQPLNEQQVFMYGPVCLDTAWRGKGVLKQLFAAVKAHTREEFDVGALFIDDSNPHSLAAHQQGLKMTVLAPFHCGPHGYQLLVFATRDQAYS